MWNPLKKVELKRDYVETFSTPHGQRVLAHILEVSGVTRPRFTSDNEMTRINEGERRLAHSIYRQVHSSMDELLKLLAEQVELSEEEKNQK